MSDSTKQRVIVKKSVDILYHARGYPPSYIFLKLVKTDYYDGHMRAPSPERRARYANATRKLLEVRLGTDTSDLEVVHNWSAWQEVLTQPRISAMRAIPLHKHCNLKPITLQCGDSIEAFFPDHFLEIGVEAHDQDGAVLLFDTYSLHKGEKFIELLKLALDDPIYNPQ